jgi:biotin carboxyl carrier protein
MSNYWVSIGENEFQVRIRGDQLTVDGEPVDVNLIALNGHGMHLLRRNQQAVEMHFSPQDASNYQVLVGGHLVQAQVKKAGLRNRTRARTTQEGDLRAPMPGLVVSIHAKEGAYVEKGELLAVVESMKMQMQMRSAVSGFVRGIEVKPGQQVDKGQLLVRVNPAV